MNAGPNGVEVALIVSIYLVLRVLKIWNRCFMHLMDFTYYKYKDVMAALEQTCENKC
jgi:hypothetical protein